MASVTVNANRVPNPYLPPIPVESVIKMGGFWLQRATADYRIKTYVIMLNHLTYSTGTLRHCPGSEVSLHDHLPDMSTPPVRLRKVTAPLLEIWCTKLHDLFLHIVSIIRCFGHLLLLSCLSLAMANPALSLFLSLPAEILTHILEFLPPQDLSVLLTTCHLLHDHAQKEVLWAQHVRGSTPTPISSPSPCSSWRDLYIAHHPFWFIPRYKIWFADRNIGGDTMTGIVILAKYDPQRGCIEAYRLVAEHGEHTFESWDYRREVIIHTFNPKVSLFLDDPVIKLDIDLERQNPSQSRVREETVMQTGSVHGVTSKISLCQPIRPTRQHRSMALWPPQIVPAKDRVRSESSTMFRNAAHKPRTLTQASDQTFRIRKYLDFRGMEGHLGVRLGEDVLTFSTLCEESYVPTSERPWQGIWVGDYSGHGCEFLLVLQKDVDPNYSRPIRASTWSSFSAATSASSSGDSEAGDSELDIVGDNLAWASVQDNAEPVFDFSPSPGPDDNPVPSCRGRLEAIKLTGDVNVPRGEYTWIAKDIGPRGFIRTADEQMFKGARVVSSLGMSRVEGKVNIAKHMIQVILPTEISEMVRHHGGSNFVPHANDRTDRYVESQLIMIDFDTLAQYWVVSLEF